MSKQPAMNINRWWWLLTTSPKSWNHAQTRLITRLCVIICLIATALLAGIGTYSMLTHMQNKIQQEQYYAVTRKIESSTLSAILDKQDALTTGLTTLLDSCPNEADWPYCGSSISFFQAILGPLHRITQTRTIYYNVRVEANPTAISDFENFVYDFYQEQGQLSVLLDSNNTVRFDGNSIHNDGGNSTNDVNPVGIFALDFTTGKKYHDTTGTSGGGKYEMLLPVVEATDLHDNADVLMFNISSHYQRVSAIDYALLLSQKLLI